jgi:uncharacterized membrane protein
MVAVHFIYDLVMLFRVWEPKNPWLFYLAQDWGGVIFLVLSGICATLGSGPVKRGLLVFGCGLLISAVTLGMYLLGFADRGIIIYFGVLHCLGACMVLWPVFRGCPAWLLAVLGGAMAAVGLYLVNGVRIGAWWLVPLGVPCYGFLSSDYFPLLPNLGYFLLGAVLGRTVYRNKESLLPKGNDRNPILRFLCWCGRKSLWIYLLHQPVLVGIIGLWTIL